MIFRRESWMLVVSAMLPHSEKEMGAARSIILRAVVPASNPMARTGRAGPTTWTRYVKACASVLFFLFQLRYLVARSRDALQSTRVGPSVTRNGPKGDSHGTFPSASLIVASILGVGLLGTIAMAAEEKLKPGDPAPPLTVSTWLHGAEVKKFEPGQVYVVEFWATWCGPCRQIMPHMGDLQDEYRDKGVTFIGFASEANDKEAKVNAFVARQGREAGLHVCV